MLFSWRFPLAFSLLVAPALACSGSDGGAVTSDAGASDGGASSDGAVACSGATPTLAGAVPPAAVGLQAGTRGLYVTDPAGGPTLSGGLPAGALVAVGGGAAFTPDPGDALRDALIDGDTAFVATATIAGPEQNGKLLAVDLATGATRTVLPTGLSRVAVDLIAADGTYVYYTQEDAATADAGIYRAPRAGGAAETLAVLPSSALRSAQLQGGDLWFAAGRETTSVYRLPGAAPGAPIAVGPLPLVGGFTVTDDAIWFAGATELTRTERDLSRPRTVVATLERPDVRDGNGPTVASVTPTTLVVKVTPAAGAPVALLAVDRATLAVKPIVCAVGFVDSVVASADGKVTWLERRAADGSGTSKVYETTR